MIGKRKISVWWLILAAWGGTALFLSARDGTATSEDSGFIVELVCSVLRFFGAKIKGWQIHGAVRKAAHVVIHVGVAYFSFRAVRDTFRERNLLYTAAIGCAIGIFLSWSFLRLVSVIVSSLDLSFEMNGTVVVVAVTFCFLIGVIFGLYPANKAAKMKPIDALHYSE